jgi:pSer/pThr/pTyr-binding forkhead associated (FHA) protein
MRNVARAGEICETVSSRPRPILTRMTADLMLWSQGGFTLRVLGGATVTVDSPFGVIGRAPGGALVIDDPAASSRHAYLHLDRRGLFAVDLATRTGTRVGPDGGLSGWLQPGDRLEVAGHVVEVVEVRLESPEPSARPLTSPLDDAGDVSLARLTLFPEGTPAEPLALNSELVFAGRSSLCGVCVGSASAMRIQCVLVRGPQGAYVVDLVGRGTWRNNQPVRGAARLYDGDALMIGAARFQCRVGSPSRALGRSAAPAVPALFEAAPVPAPSMPPLQGLPAEARAEVLAWLMIQLQGRQDEAHRRQSDFQTELVRLVAEIHRDNQAVLQRHLDRADVIQRELSEIREAMKERLGADAAAHFPALSGPKPPPLRIAPVAPPDNPEAAANWLIHRVNQLDQESRSSWKDLLGRLSGRKAAD